MAWRFHGHARVNPRSPRAWGVCDRCYRVFNLQQLSFQHDWRSNKLANLWIRVCRSCYDTPQDQLRPRILPPDPVPVYMPRPENFTSDDNLQGFTYWMLAPESSPPTDKAAVLAQVAILSGIATPVSIHDRAGTIASVNVAQQVMAANPGRNWLLLYNPSSSAMAISVNTPSLGSSVNGAPVGVLMGEGAALFWANAQGGAQVPQGALSIIGTKAGSPFYAWDS